MFWVLQKNRYTEVQFQEILKVLEDQNVKYELVDLTPEMEPDIDPVGSVFVIGEPALLNISKEKGWLPGYCGEGLEYSNMLDKYKSWALNEDSVIVPLKDVEEKWDRFFVRTNAAMKQFSGRVMTWKKFETVWKPRILKMTTVTENDLIVMASFKKIYDEYRFYIVDGKVVTGSSIYNQARKVFYVNVTDDTNPELWVFAQLMADLWSPNRAFCLGICSTVDGYRVTKVSAINSTCFCACDMKQFVEAINAMNF